MDFQIDREYVIWQLFTWNFGPKLLLGPKFQVNNRHMPNGARFQVNNYTYHHSNLVVVDMGKYLTAFKG